MQFLFLCGLAAVAKGSELAVPRDLRGYEFVHFVAEFEKSYGDEEHATRRSVFNENLRKINAHNAEYYAGKHTWFMAVNHFADWTAKEFKNYQRRLNGPAPDSRPWTTLEVVPSNVSNPESVDWREKGKVTKVKNQGGCGSCWAFSATESMESALAMATGKLLELAPQAYVNCVENPQHCGGTGGCEGATMELAFGTSASKGLPLEADLPYKGRDGACKSYTAAAKNTGFVKISPNNDAQALETAIATKGPISVTVAAEPWQLYGGGVFSGCSRGGAIGSDLDHGVQAVGYTKDYWIVRNSWGPSWGEKGYIRLSRAADARTFTDKTPGDGIACEPLPKTQTVGGECGILFDTSYPTGLSDLSVGIVV